MSMCAEDESQSSESATQTLGCISSPSLCCSFGEWLRSRTTATAESEPTAGTALIPNNLYSLKHISDLKTNYVVQRACTSSSRKTFNKNITHEDLLCDQFHHTTWPQWQSIPPPIPPPCLPAGWTSPWFLLPVDEVAQVVEQLRIVFN